MKKTLIAGAVLAASVFSASAMANTGTTDFYLWGDVGTSHTTDYDGYFAHNDRDLDGNMYGMGVGATINDSVFVELGYQSLGTSEFSGSTISNGIDTSGSLENEHSSVTGRIGKLFKWNPHVTFSAHVGAAHVNSETSGRLYDEDINSGTITGYNVSDEESGLVGLVGVGMNFNITENLDARVRFERMIGVESAYDDYHMDNLTAGIAYRL